MFGLKIFVRVQTFRRVPPVLPCNFCHPAWHSEHLCILSPLGVGKLFVILLWFDVDREHCISIIYYGRVWTCFPALRPLLSIVNATKVETA